jgi:hypothetical protein
MLKVTPQLGFTLKIQNASCKQLEKQNHVCQQQLYVIESITPSLHIGFKLHLVINLRSKIM